MPQIEAVFDNPDYKYTYEQVKDFAEKVAKVDNLLDRVLDEVTKYPDFKAKEAGDAALSLLQDNPVMQITPGRLDLYLAQAVQSLRDDEDYREGLDHIQRAGHWFRSETMRVLQGVGSHKK